MEQGMECLKMERCTLLSPLPYRTTVSKPRASTCLLLSCCQPFIYLSRCPFVFVVSLSWVCAVNWTVDCFFPVYHAMGLRPIFFVTFLLLVSLVVAILCLMAELQISSLPFYPPTDLLFTVAVVSVSPTTLYILCVVLYAYRTSISSFSQLVLCPSCTKSHTHNTALKHYFSLRYL